MSKYNAIRTTVDGITFDSKKEAKRYGELRKSERSGDISDLTLQPRFDIVINGKKICFYKADFKYIEDGQEVIEDVKGFKTAIYRLKKKLVEASYPGVTIQEV